MATLRYLPVKTPSSIHYNTDHLSAIQEAPQWVSSQGEVPQTVPIWAGGADAPTGYFWDRLLGSLPTCAGAKTNGNPVVRSSQIDMQGMITSQNECHGCRVLLVA